MAKTKPNAKASLSRDTVITRICATRALKNAKVIRKAAPHIIPPENRSKASAAWFPSIS